MKKEREDLIACFLIALGLILLYFSLAWMQLGLSDCIFAEFPDIHIIKHHIGFVWFGHKSIAAFDFWSIEHFCAGIILGWICFTQISNDKKKIYLLSWLPFVYFILFWEGHEYWAEIGGYGSSIMNWKDGPECFINRLIFDPLLVIIGGVLIKGCRRKLILRFALIFTAIGVPINSMASTCMSIQQYILNFFK